MATREEQKHGFSIRTKCGGAAKTQVRIGTNMSHYRICSSKICLRIGFHQAFSAQETKAALIAKGASKDVGKGEKCRANLPRMRPSH
ncbi:hypothetical protein ACFSE1_14675 [Rhizobium helianthi]|uniref:Uncharacterized protein n=1 Tax=Rhizobium helianthi TaxID=1132695 RepID=A0ABW4M7Q5_9HYPH